MNALGKAAQVGNRKLVAFYAVFAFVVVFTLGRALMPLWVPGVEPLDDIPKLVKEIVVWSVGLFFFHNAASKFSPAVRDGVEKS
jgi:hypothetical protein